jgi:hypothetical protein
VLSSSAGADIAEAPPAVAGALNLGEMKLKTPNGLSVIWPVPTSNGLKNRGRTFAEPREVVAFWPYATTPPHVATMTTRIKTIRWILMMFDVRTSTCQPVPYCFRPIRVAVDGGSPSDG